LPRGFPWERGCRSLSHGHFPAHEPLGLGRVASRRASPVPVLVHHAGKTSLLPMAREGTQHPRVRRRCGQGCPLVMVFHHGACCQKEPAPVFPAGTLALGPP